MKSFELSLPLLGSVVATRAMLGVGVGLLVAEALPETRRKAIGWALIAIGALSTIPLAANVLSHRHDDP